MSRLTEPVGSKDHLIGRLDAPAVLVEYGDYECPFCARAHFEMAEVLRRVGADTCYVFRHFPLTSVHPHALLAAQAAEAAGAQGPRIGRGPAGRFWPMHSMLFENQDALEPGDLRSYAETLGLDVALFTEDLERGVHLPRVQHDFRSGVRSGVHGTPGFFLNGLRVDRGWDAETLTAEIGEAIQQHRAVGGRVPPLHVHR
jgi:protein-disulfide isomerase